MNYGSAHIHLLRSDGAASAMKTTAYASDRSSESSDWVSHGSQLESRSFGPQAEQAKAGTGGIDLLKGPLFAGGMPVRAKLTIGEPNDKYEQEADRVAEQVMSMPDGAVQGRVQREGLQEEEELQMKPLIQRAGLQEEEELQMKPLIQRAGLQEEEELQMKPLIQRAGLQEEEELQMKPLIQRAGLQEEEELQMKPVLQREGLQEEEEELQMKPVLQREGLQEEEELQMKADSSKQSPAATSSLEDRLNGSKGGGSPLSEDVRSFMEPRFGADFSGVRVHTGNEAVQMNQEVGAQAFAHGRDVYFGAGRGPGNDALTAHELTHVVQQTGAVQRKSMPAGVKIQSQPVENYLSRKEVARRLDFVVMKRNAPQVTKALLNQLGIGNYRDTYGHWWTEILPQGQSQPGDKSYGWWPKVDPTIKQTLKIDRIDGILNAGQPHDPHHGEKANEEFKPAIQVDEDANFLEIYNRTVANIESFAHSFSGTWNWRLAWGKNCHTFQERMMKQLGMEKNDEAPFLSRERKIDELEKNEYAKIEKEKPEWDDVDEIAKNSIYQELGIVGPQYNKEYENSTKSIKGIAGREANLLKGYLNKIKELEADKQKKLDTANDPNWFDKLQPIEEEIKVIQQKIDLQKQWFEDQKIKVNSFTGEYDETQFIHHHVKYLTTQPQREQFQLDVSGGILQQQKQPFNTASSFTSHSGRGWAIYVMDPNGFFYAGPHQVGQFHHSSFLAGGVVAGAGELKTDHSGKIQEISNKSGHYTPSSSQMFQVFTQLEKGGVDLNVPFHFYSTIVGNETLSADKFFTEAKERNKFDTIAKSVPRNQTDLDKIADADTSKYKNLLRVNDTYMKLHQEEFRTSGDFAKRSAKNFAEAYVKITASLKKLEESRNFEELDDDSKALEQEIAQQAELKQYYEERLHDQGITIKNPDTGEIDESQMDKLRTEYLATEPEREKYHLTVGSNFLQNGQPFNTASLFTAFWGRGAAIYVMDPGGEFYAGPHKVGQFHHSSFLAGGAVAGAGEMKTSESGELQAISNKSGHYKTSPLHMFQVLDELTKRSVNIDSTPLLLVTEEDSNGSDYKGGAGKFYEAQKRSTESQSSPDSGEVETQEDKYSRSLL